MKENKYFFFMCVLLWTLAIGGGTARAADTRDDVEEEGSARGEEGAARGEEAAARGEEAAARGEEAAALGQEVAAAILDDIQEEEDADKPPEMLQLYEAGDPEVTSVILYYLKLEGGTCTRKRLALSVVGNLSGHSSVAYLLKKLSHVFNVSDRATETLMLSAGAAWQSLLKEEAVPSSLTEQLDPIDDQTPIKDLCTCTLFLGRKVNAYAESYTCADVSLDDTPLGALPVATEAALPAVIVEGAGPYLHEIKEQEEMGPAVSVVELLRRMLSARDRLYLTKVRQGEEQASREEEELRIEMQDAKREMNRDDVFLHTQQQLDVIFPQETYLPVTVVDPPTRTIQVKSRGVHAIPACKSSYVCQAQRELRLSDASWEILKRGPPRVGPSPRSRSDKWDLVAKLLVARSGGQGEQNPQVVLLTLLKNKDNGEERWAEHLLTWVEKDDGKGELSPADIQTFRQVLAAHARHSNSIVRLLPESSLRRALVNKVIRLYNINKEELWSMWDKDPQHSAADPTTMEGVFSRPINIPVLRPMNPQDVLVSPADSVVQQLYRLAPNEKLEIPDLTIPQIKDTPFSLAEFLYGKEVETPVKLADPQNRLNVVVHYLSPRDYHRVHSPADWTIRNTYHVPACLPTGTKQRPAPGSTLQTVERVSLVGTWDPEERNDRLFFSVVLVGAAYTGGIQLAWEDKPMSLRHPLRECDKTDVTHVAKLHHMCVGQELGGFKFGSSVVLLFETPPGFQINVNTCDGVFVGQTEGLRESGGRKLRQRCVAYPSAFGSALSYLTYLRKETESAGKSLMRNKQLPQAWRANAKTAAEEVARSVEKGLIYANSLAQHIFHLYGTHQELWERVVVGQPVALIKAGGLDGTSSRFPPICYPAPDKERIRVVFQGRHSSIALFLKTTNDNGTLFQQPSFGCDGHPNYGNRAGGLQASWQLSGGGDITVKVMTTGGLGGQRPCVDFDTASLVHGLVEVTAKCSLDWYHMQSGTTVAECHMRQVGSKIVKATNFDVKTKEFICPAPQTPPEAAPSEGTTSTGSATD